KRGTPCFTAHSPRSCKYGPHSREWPKSSATLLDNRMCLSSPQSMTLCARLIPAPATFAESFTSRTSLIGPLWMPIRNFSCGYSFNFLLRSEEHTSELQSRGHLVCRLLLE